MYSFATKSRNRSILTILLAASMVLGAACASSSDKKDEPPEQTTETQPTEMTQPPYVGYLKSAPISGMGFHQAVLEIEVNSDFTATGMFEGGFDQRYFEVPLDGKVDRMDGSIELTGQVSTHDLTVAGDLSQRGWEGTISGEVYNEEVDVPMAAEPAEKQPDTSDEDVDAETPTN